VQSILDVWIMIKWLHHKLVCPICYYWWSRMFSL